MKVLIIGGGGREHAIALCMSKSRRVEKLYCVPGNAGIAQIAECEPSIGVMEFEKITAFAKEKEIFSLFGQDFKKRKEKEIEEILKKNPYNDI